MKSIFKSIAAAIGLLALGTLSSQAADPLRVGVSAGPYGEILEFAGRLAAKEGLGVKVIEFTDWNMPNAALANGEIDVNNFQHIPYLNNQIKQRGYDLVPVATSIVVPMGIYSSKAKVAADLKPGSTIAIPNDPTNAARALFLIEKAGLVKLRDGSGLDATIADIAENASKIKFIELDAAQLPALAGRCGRRRHHAELRGAGRAGPVQVAGAGGRSVQVASGLGRAPRPCRRCQDQALHRDIPFARGA